MRSNEVLPHTKSDVQESATVEGHIQDAVPKNVVAPLHSRTGFSDALFTIELCAGSAMLSAILKRDGFHPIAVDFSCNKHRPHLHVISLDLRAPSTWRFLEYAVVTRIVLHVCGTSSRARGITLPDGRPGPKPLRLRDDFHPMGFPWLDRNDLKRVTSANEIYVPLANFCSGCIR